MKALRVSALALLALLSACAGPNTATDSGAAPELTAIEALDLPRYLGRWYEIAKFPNRFQKQCAGETTADYRLTPAGTISVLNRCRNQQGEMEEALGIARQLGPANSPKLQVRFAPAWLSFIPGVWGNYWVVDLDQSYQLAAVSEPSRRYLWILSRQAEVSPSTLVALLERLRLKGFDVQKLVKTQQAPLRRLSPE